MSTFQELCEAVFAGKTIQWAHSSDIAPLWVDVRGETHQAVIGAISASKKHISRVKPDIKVIAYRIYLDKHHTVQVWRNIVSQVELERAPVFIRWLGDHQAIEVEL